MALEALVGFARAVDRKERKEKGNFSFKQRNSDQASGRHSKQGAWRCCF